MLGLHTCLSFLLTKITNILALNKISGRRSLWRFLYHPDMGLWNTRMFVSVFSLLVYGIYNKNALNSQHLFVFLSHPYEFNLGLGPSHCFGGLARPLIYHKQGITRTFAIFIAQYWKRGGICFVVDLPAFNVLRQLTTRQAFNAIYLLLKYIYIYINFNNK